MNRPLEPGPLSASDWRRLHDLASRFEEAWADDADLAAFLPPPGDPLRAAALRELVKTDLEIRWRRGRPVLVERYFERFSELAGDARRHAELLCEEYHVRQRHGDRPSLDSYRARFPGCFPELERLVREQPMPTVTRTVTTPPSGPTPSPAARAPERPHGLPVGGYTLDKLIGRGGFGEVWRATAPGGFPAAIKIILRPADHEERVREERALATIRQLHHHFLIRTQACWAEPDRLLIVMDLADGNLRERLHACRATGAAGIPFPELVGYFREAAEAVDYLHNKDVLHRDIKPDNLLLIEGHVRLADFGLARHQDRLLASVSGSGTPAYMAPEVWMGHAGRQSDQYSLAYSYAELRLGHRAFAGEDYATVMFDHLDNEPDLNPLPEAEQAVLRRALAKEPSQRFPSCADFIRALEHCRDSRTHLLPSAAPASTDPVPTMRRAPRMRPTQPAVELPPVNPETRLAAPEPPASAPPPPPAAEPQPRARFPLRRLLAALVAVLAAFALGVGAWWLRTRGLP